MKMYIKMRVHSEEGQAMILVALAMVVLLGFSALAVDVGVSTFQKANLQKAVDSAALAGAQDLPETSQAIATAENFAWANGIDEDEDVLIVTTPYGGESAELEVSVTRNVPYTVARVLGFSDRNITARAVVIKNPSWAGEALPFLNLDDEYETNSSIVAWEKTGPGDFESLWPDEYEIFNGGNNDDHSKTYFTIDYSDGITIKKGTVATIKQEVGYVYDQHKPLYIFSLSSDVIKSEKYIKNKIKNKDVIPLADLVLLQVTFDSYDYSGKTLYFTVTEVYDINNGIYPVDYLNDDSEGTTRLVD